jgi:hypothetical protein
MPYALVILILLIATPVSAQAPERLPWFTVDAHAATVGLPQAEGWVPEVSADTELPGRNWGLSTGATVYPFAWNHHVRGRRIRDRRQGQ